LSRVVDEALDALSEAPEASLALDVELGAVNAVDDSLVPSALLSELLRKLDGIGRGEPLPAGISLLSRLSPLTPLLILSAGGAL